MQWRSLMCCGALVAVLALPAAVQAQQKSVRQCNAEWTANRAALQASGKLRKDFIAECRGLTANTATKTAPPDQPREAAPPPRRPATVGLATSEGQHATEEAAKAQCPGDTVVWVNLSSKIYHFSNAKTYGRTKNGTYMCERDTAQAGFRAAKNEKRPGG
jgi:hypothetical protein